MRKSFKEIIQKDIDIFMNAEEYANIHTIDGKQMTVTIDNNEMLDREKRLDQHMDGVYVEQLLIYVKGEEYGNLPAFNKLLTLDNKKYKVTDAIDEDGMYSITLEANRVGNVRG